jgi:hypothetical protein
VQGFFIADRAYRLTLRGKDDFLRTTHAHVARSLTKGVPVTTTETVWKSLIETDASFSETFPEGECRAAYREVLEKAWPELAPLLEKTATLGVFGLARLAILRQVGPAKLHERIFNNLPPAMLGGKTPAAMVADTDIGLQSMLDELEKIKDTLADFPEGAMCEELFVSASLFREMGPRAQLKYAMGTLTIGELLQLQPSMFLAMT